MDNLKAYKAAGVTAACGAAKVALHHVPPYSPNLSLIEEC